MTGRLSTVSNTFLFLRWVRDAYVTDLPNSARGAPVAFITTEQRKAGLISTEFPHLTALGAKHRFSGRLTETEPGVSSGLRFRRAN
jgi:hypothetical protein